MLSISCCRAFAASLTLPADVMAGVDGITPDLADLFGEARGAGFDKVRRAHV